MNAIEIEEAVSDLAADPYDSEEFPFAFLAAFGNKEVTIKKLRIAGKSSTNKSDVEGGVLQRLNIHIAIADAERLDDTLTALRESPQTAKAKAKYVLATDGEQVVAEELSSGEVLSCRYDELGDNFGFFLTLAGISVVREVKDNPIDIKATSRLNKLYVELLNSNPDWATPDKQIAFNQFLARLVFCFFAEDTGVFAERGLFTSTVTQMTEADGGNTHLVLQELFNAMDSDPRDGGREPPVKSWADRFPYVNGGLFSGETNCPTFTRTARSYLIRAGELDWQSINPDIFGSMIQAVADDEERGSLGMHYTSVPNIEKVLNPLFLDSLNEQLRDSGDNARKLLNLRKRLENIHVFDPACGSGNFLVIAYIRMREIEAELMNRRDEPMIESIIKLTQFYGIEIKPFAVEVARLSLLIAEFQCNVRLIGQRQAQMLILPLHETGHVVAGNSLRLDWGDVCSLRDDGEIYICGNPPYLGSKWQSDEQKRDLHYVFEGHVKNWKSLDYVGGWFFKASKYAVRTNCTAAFVSTNSICQGQQVPILWPEIFRTGNQIVFAHRDFQWSNLASHNAGVTVVIVAISSTATSTKKLYTTIGRETSVKNVEAINAYLIAGSDVVVNQRATHLSELPEMTRGNSPTDGGHLLLEEGDLPSCEIDELARKKYLKPYVGSKELIAGTKRYCIWIEDSEVEKATSLPAIKSRVEKVREFRLGSKKKATVKAANWAHRFDERKPVPSSPVICIPVISSQNRPYLPAGVLPAGTVVSNKAFTLPGDSLWPFSIICSRLNLSWVAAVCARMRTDYSYTNTLGWNTFPLPNLTEQNKADLTQSAENILLAREAHFPSTIADLYKPDEMPSDLLAAHERNDETLERIYIGRRFKNDTERLEKLFALYTEMTKESS